MRRPSRPLAAVLGRQKAPCEMNFEGVCSALDMHESIRFASKLLFSFVVLAVVVTLCYFFVDRPLSLYLESLHLSYIPVLRYLEYLPVWSATCALAFLLTAPWLCAISSARRVARVALRIAVSVALGTFIKNELKGIFGRYWTRTWVCENPSLNGSGDYAFNWFHGGPQYGSFPSGHACVIAATATALALCFPGQRAVRFGAMVVAIASCSAVLAQNFHFLGDILAGAWLGVATALCVGRYWPQPQA